MKKSTLLMILSLVLALALTAGTTLAYLTDTDADVNVMTLGNVHIKQIELERDENGELQEFTQYKPMYPAVGTVDWDPVDQEWPAVSDTASSPLFDDAKLANVVDKFVFVENTGASDAYVRTIFAFELGSLEKDKVFPDKLLHLNKNDKNDEAGSGHWAFTWLDEPVEIDGNKYVIAEALYLHKKSDQGTPAEGILPAGATSYPSLLQLFFDPMTTNEDLEAIDGNGNGLYDVLVVSQAVQTNGFSDAQTALDTAFGEISATSHPWLGKAPNDAPTDIDDVRDWGSADELINDLQSGNAGAAGSGDVTITLDKDYDLTDVDWTPIKVDGYHGAGVVTIEGNGHYIKGLTSPLFSGGFAGNSGIVIKDLTIEDSDIVSTNDVGSGAFIESVDSMQKIELINCHLIDSTVTGPDRVGGLIGWTAGYNNLNDGPVKTYVTIKDCSVIGCTINGGGSVGGINGHAGNNAWTFTTIENCTVKNNELVSTEKGDWRVGVVVGTANVGEVTITGITESGNTLTQADATTPACTNNLYGRFVPGSTGKLTIDGVAIN